MALAFTRGEGDSFYVDQAKFVVETVHALKGFTLRGPNDELLEVGDDKAEQIAPDVYVSDGFRHVMGRARVVFNAPQDVLLLRGELVDGDEDAA